ncbi:MAG TPA: glycoside hydrolase family 3 N-terminal domain-containing protein [Actinophytocola sp.]|uniref:glycoside hydrolase family 3 protein n=1 Tax=Actinophytocola sp. TaxID=1872138 RepID=UPI002DDD5E34|nr:glycoside hydrolase family 3 N-terminal domain-containing protein [Actinophytocola sp.]HEV2779981.1 glycoside hydrolase family 3 N-terminal domain-containing protein [Actinophytocola sp.]
MSARSSVLLGLADAVLQPGFEGTAPPAWLRRRLAGGLGGVALFSRNIEEPAQVRALVDAMRRENPDVLVAIDEEGGDVTRLEVDHGSSRPGNLALGAVDDLELTEAVARDIGRDLAAVGVTVNYAPDADVNSNPDNPVIGVRSFGAWSELVARHTAAWVRGLQSTGVAACAKHFPGHGDTGVDSHLALPTVHGTAEDIALAALPPFRAAVDAGVKAIMTGHLLVPAYDPAVPATMSPRILLDLLRGELGFTGLIITDGIEMRAVADRYGLAGAAVGAIAAGADAICVGGGLADEGTVELLRTALVDAVMTGDLPEDRLADAAARVRELAAWTATARTEPVAAAGGEPVGLVAARRAVRVTVRPGGTLPLPAAPHVVELAPALHQAIDRGTPWGVAELLARLRRGTTAVRLYQGDLEDPEQVDKAALEPAAGRPLVLVVRDAHRQAWMSATLDRLLAARPDAAVVELGVPGPRPLGAIYVATHGAAKVCADAAAEVLTQKLA